MLSVFLATIAAAIASDMNEADRDALMLERLPNMMSLTWHLGNPTDEIVPVVAWDDGSIIGKIESEEAWEKHQPPGYWNYDNLNLVAYAYIDAHENASAHISYRKDGTTHFHLWANSKEWAKRATKRLWWFLFHVLKREPKPLAWRIGGPFLIESPYPWGMLQEEGEKIERIYRKILEPEIEDALALPEEPFMGEGSRSRALFAIGTGGNLDLFKAFSQGMARFLDKILPVRVAYTSTFESKAIITIETPLGLLIPVYSALRVPVKIELKWESHPERRQRKVLNEEIAKVHLECIRPHRLSWVLNPANDDEWRWDHKTRKYVDPPDPVYNPFQYFVDLEVIAKRSDFGDHMGPGIDPGTLLVPRRMLELPAGGPFLRATGLGF